MDAELEAMLNEADATANQFGDTTSALEKVIDMFKKSDTQAIVITQKGPLYAVGMNIKKPDDDNLDIESIHIASKFVQVLSDAMQSATEGRSNKGSISKEDCGTSGMAAIAVLAHALEIAEDIIGQGE